MNEKEKLVALIFLLIFQIGLIIQNVTLETELKNFRPENFEGN